MSKQPRVAERLRGRDEDSGAHVVVVLHIHRELTNALPALQRVTANLIHQVVPNERCTGSAFEKVSQISAFDRAFIQDFKEMVRHHVAELLAMEVSEFGNPVRLPASGAARRPKASAITVKEAAFHHERRGFSEQHSPPNLAPFHEHRHNREHDLPEGRSVHKGAPKARAQ
jgi:hypothetical protein